MSQVGGDHYKRCQVQPFDLFKAMESTGSVFVDSCRTCIIRYAFRIKGDKKKLAEDLRKASHYALEAAKHLEEQAEKDLR